MTLTELKALAQDLRNERTEALRKADRAQACLNSIQQQMAARKLEAQMDTPMAEMMGGWATGTGSHHGSPQTVILITSTQNTNELRQP